MGASFTECECGMGGHQHPEIIITEFLDDNDMPVAEGEAGEITITTLGVEGMPLLRFKTGDVCHHYNEPCACSRNTTRLGPVLGRKQQMIKFKGTTLYHPALFNVLDHFEEIDNYIIEVSTNEIGTDKINILLGCKTKSTDFDQKLKEHFRAKLRVIPDVEFLSPEEISLRQFPAGSRKPVKFVDKRK
jgi:phenylacetate-CoA ligase